MGEILEEWNGWRLDETKVDGLDGFFAGFFVGLFSGNEVLLMDVMMVDRGFVDFREDWTWYNLSYFFLQAWWESH